MSMTAQDHGTMPTTSYDQYQDPDEPWPYDVVPQNPYENPEAVMWKGDKEYAFADTEGRIWQGRYTRAMIENALRTQQPVWLGFDHKDDEVPILYRELFRGIFIGGQPGTGKTTTGSNILLQLTFLNRGWVFLDPGGEEFYDFLRRCPESLKDRIVPINPQGGWRGQTIKLNYLETYHEPGEPGYEEEVENKTSNILPMIEAEYPLMKGVAENMVKALIKAHKQDEEYDYCLIDVYQALDETGEYADMVEEQKLSVLRPYARKIRDEIEGDDMEPLLRRLKTWIESDLIRPLLCSRQSDISIAEAIEDDLCIIVNCDIGSDDARKMLMKAFSTGVWSTIFSRQSATERKMMEMEGIDVPTVGGDPDRAGDQFKPFFFAADEWHALDTEDTNMGQVLAMARKKRLGVIALTQQLGQLGDAAQNAFKRNTAAKLSFNPGDDKDERRTLAKAFTGKSQEDLNALDRFRAITTVTDKQGQSTPAVEAHMLPEYPYRRDLAGANQWIKDALEKWGSPVKSDEAVLSEGRFGEEIDPADLDSDGSMNPRSDALQEALCKAAYDTAIREHGVGNEDTGTKWVAYDAVQSEFERATGVECATSEMGALVMATPGVSFDDSGQDMIRCTPDGYSRFMPAGTSSSEGGVGHHALLRDLYDGLTAQGFAVRIPEQPGGNESAPDALATVRPEATGAEVLDGLDVAAGDELVIEAEKSTGDSKAAQTARNLAGAMREETPALFISRPDIAETVASTLAGPYAHTVYDDGTVRTWNRKKLKINDDQMLRPAGAEYTVWKERPDGEVHLTDSEGRTHATFTSWEQVFEDPSQYPARESHVDTSTIGRGKEWRNVARPFVPKRELPREVEESDYAVAEAHRDGMVVPVSVDGEDGAEDEGEAERGAEETESGPVADDSDTDESEASEDEGDVWAELEEQFGE